MYLKLIKVIREIKQSNNNYIISNGSNKLLLINYLLNSYGYFKVQYVALEVGQPLMLH